MKTKKASVISMYGLTKKKTYKVKIGQRIFCDDFSGEIKGLDTHGNVIMLRDDDELWTINPKGFYDDDFKILKG